MEDVCIAQVVKLFWIVAISFEVLLAASYATITLFEVKYPTIFYGTIFAQGVLTLMITACTLTLLKAGYEFKNCVKVTKSVKQNNTFRNHCILFISMNVFLVVLFVVVVVDVYATKKLNAFVNLIILMESVFSLVTGTYIALRLVSLSKPPDCYACPVTNNKIHALTKVYIDKQLCEYIESQNVSKDELEKLEALKAYEEIAIEY